MSKASIGEFQLDEDELSDDWYVLQRSNNLVHITSFDAPRLEIEYDGEGYSFTSKYDEIVEKCAKNVESFKEYYSESPPDLDAIISTLKYIKSNHQNKDE